MTNPVISAQGWTSWSSFRATRTRKSTRRPSTWSSATSTLKTRTHLWLLLWICSSSSSSSSSARPRWMASSYNASHPPVLHHHSHLCSIISLSAHCYDQGLPRPAPSHRQRDQFNHYHDYEKRNITGARVCVCPTWVKFCSLASQFVKVSLIILSCAELTSAPEPHLLAQAPASPTSRMSL